MVIVGSALLRRFPGQWGGTDGTFRLSTCIWICSRVLEGRIWLLDASRQQCLGIAKGIIITLACFPRIKQKVKGRRLWWAHIILFHFLWHKMYTGNSNSYHFFDNLNLSSFEALKFMNGVNGNLLVELCGYRVFNLLPSHSWGKICLAKLLQEVHFTWTWISHFVSLAPIFLLHPCGSVLH